MEMNDALWFAIARAMAALDQFEAAVTPKVKEVMRVTEPTGETSADGAPVLRVVEASMERCRKCVDSGTAEHLDAGRACWDTFVLVSIIHEHLPLFAKVIKGKKEERDLHKATQLLLVAIDLQFSFWILINLSFSLVCVCFFVCRRGACRNTTCRSRRRSSVRPRFSESAATL
jgi:hypothetical protein